MWSDSRSARIQREEGRTWQANNNVHLIYWSQIKRKWLSNPGVTEPQGVPGNPLIKAGENTPACLSSEHVFLWSDALWCKGRETNSDGWDGCRVEKCEV